MSLVFHIRGQCFMFFSRWIAVEGTAVQRSILIP